MTEPTPANPDPSPLEPASPPSTDKELFEVEETAKPAAVILNTDVPPTTGVPASPAPIAGSADESVDDEKEPEPFVKPGRGTPQHVFYAGLFILMAAMIATALSTTNKPFPNVVLTGYLGIAHTITGVMALVLSARLAGKPLGSVELAIARMLVAVACFLLGLNIGFKIDYIGKVLDTLLALAGYSGAMFFLFRFTRDTFLIVLSMHAVTAVLIYLSGIINAWASVAAK